MAPLASFTCSVKVPAAVGVPVTAPVAAFSESPAGSEPVATEKVRGAVPPVTVGAGAVKALPTVPAVADAHVIERAALTV